MPLAWEHSCLGIHQIQSSTGEQGPGIHGFDGGLRPLISCIMKNYMSVPKNWMNPIPGVRILGASRCELHAGSHYQVESLKLRLSKPSLLLQTRGERLAGQSQGNRLAGQDEGSPPVDGFVSSVSGPNQASCRHDHGRNLRGHRRGGSTRGGYAYWHADVVAHA